MQTEVPDLKSKDLFCIFSFLSLLFSFLPSCFSLVARFRQRSVASGLKATLKECLASLQLGLFARQTTHTHSRKKLVANMKYIFEPNPQKTAL